MRQAGWPASTKWSSCLIIPKHDMIAQYCYLTYRHHPFHLEGVRCQGVCSRSSFIDAPQKIHFRDFWSSTFCRVGSRVSAISKEFEGVRRVVGERERLKLSTTRRGGRNQEMGRAASTRATRHTLFSSLPPPSRVLYHNSRRQAHFRVGNRRGITADCQREALSLA